MNGRGDDASGDRAGAGIHNLQPGRRTAAWARPSLADVTTPNSVWRYGIGGFGTGSTPQISDAQTGSGGVGISAPFPCRDGEQLGSLAGLQTMQLPLKTSMSG